MAEQVIQRTVFPAERQLQPLYYRWEQAGGGPAAEPAPADRFSVRLGRGARLSTDTYFNTFFEGHWRQYTRLGRLRLRLTLSGAGAVRLLRRNGLAGVAVLHAAAFDGERAEVVLDVPPPKLHPREAGLLHFEVTAHSDGVLLSGARWIAEGEAPAPVRLVVGCCTFDREPYLARNLATLLDDAEAAAAVSTLVVVDQGTRKVRHAPGFAAVAARAGAKLCVVEQDNHGGAGGFTRAILEARGVPGATHVLLMDDDITLEPESVFRAAAFLARARRELAVGAPMLDMLRPLEVYEAGGSIDPALLCFSTPVRRQRVDAPEALAPLREVRATHYNAWWFFAFPLDLVDKHGLPLPLFLRGDDAEFGYRLLGAGVPTVTLPGLGVWHEPFDMKNGGWQAYYDFRNRLVLAALHLAPGRYRLASAFLQRLGHSLLRLDYGQAAMLCEAVADFCRGPDLLAARPEAVHRKVIGLQQGQPPERVPRIYPLPAARPRALPASPWGRALHLARCALRQVLRRAPAVDAAARAVLPEAEAGWHVLGMQDVVAVDGWDPDHYQVVRRSRKRFLGLLARGLWGAARLCWGHRRVVAGWRAAAPRLASPAFWRAHLGVEPGATEGGPGRRAA